MNSDSLVQSLQKGIRVTLGATASLIEVLQDPQKREENLSKLSQDLGQLSQEWAAKGEETEQEARNFVDRWMGQRSGTASTPTDAPSSTTPTPTDTAPEAPPAIQLELQELTAQIAAIRAELEKMRDQDPPSQ